MERGVIWPEGPRDWSPRFKKAMGQVRVLRSVIPPELILEVDPDANNFISGDPPRIGRLRVGDTTVNLTEVYRYQPGIEGKVAFVVVTGKPKEGKAQVISTVWMLSDGRIALGREIRTLLQGQIDGFKHLAGRWPFGDDPLVMLE